MNIPLTPLPSAATTPDRNRGNDNHTVLPPPPALHQSALALSTTATARTMPSTADAIQAIYTDTYSLIGLEFLGAIVRELARWTHADTVVIYQLMAREQYMQRELQDGTGPTMQSSKLSAVSVTPSRDRSPVQPSFVFNDGSSPPKASSSSRTSPLSTRGPDEEVLMVRASYSQVMSPSYGTNFAMQLSAVEDTPYMSTLLNSACFIPEKAMLDTPTFPTTQGFLGLRLDATSNVKEVYSLGMLCILTQKPMDGEAMQHVHRLLETVQQRVTRELERVIHEERLVQAKNEAKMDAENKIKFLADMSHEIRTPMSAVIALTDLLLQERGSLNHEQTEHLEVIQTSGHHLLTVINDILDLSKINHDPKFNLETRRFSLRKCVKDALNMARHQASLTQQNKVVSVFEYPSNVNDRMPLRQMIMELEESGYLPPINTHMAGKTRLPLLWRIDPDVPDILMGDTMRLTQILLNLCSNAVKFTKEGGIRVRIKRYVPTPFQPSAQEESVKMFKQRYDAKIENMWSRAMRRMNSDGKSGDDSENDDSDQEGGMDKAILEISVTDTGIGIPADRLPQLFKSFSQIDISTARRYGGTGLGLAISSTLVNHMGGGLWVESEEQEGSCFALTLPLGIATNGMMDDAPGTESASTASVVTSPPSPVSTFSDENTSIHSAFGDRDNASINDSSTSSSPQLSSHTAVQQPLPSQQTLSPPQPWSLSSPQPTQRQKHDHQQQYHDIRETEDSRNHIPAITAQASDESNKSNLNTSIHESSAPHTPAIANHHSMTKSFSTEEQHHHQQRQQQQQQQQQQQTPSRVVRVAHNKARHHHHHHKKAPSNDENLAMLYPIKIMLAEDNVLNQKIAISILKRLGYHDVVIANNGREVLELMREIKFDIIFMDLYMPEMDGLEATRAIISERETGCNQHQDASSSSVSRSSLLNVAEVYIIALTASASRQDRQICIDAGMNDFISKPFTMMEMKSALKNCASKRKKRRKQQQDDDSRYHLISSNKNEEELLHADDPMDGVENMASAADHGSNPPSAIGEAQKNSFVSTSVPASRN